MNAHARSAAIVAAALSSLAGCSDEAACWFDLSSAAETDELFYVADCGLRPRGLHSIGRDEDTPRLIREGSFSRSVPTRDGRSIALTTGFNEIMVVSSEDGHATSPIRHWRGYIGEIQLSPERQGLWVTVWGTPSTASGVALVDAEAIRQYAYVPIAANPVGLAIEPSGEHLVVASSDAGAVAILDASDVSPSATADTTGALDVAFFPDGSKVAILEDQSNRVVVRDARTLLELGSFPTGPEPRQIAVSPDGRLLAVTERLEGDVRLFDTETMQQSTVLSVGGGPDRILLTAYGTAVVALFVEHRIIEVDLSSGAIVRTL